MDKKTIVIGVIGADVHAVGNKIIDLTLKQKGFNVVNLGVMVSQEEFIEAAVETQADAIIVSSLYGHGEIDCMGFREKCDEAGLKGLPLFVGGNLVVGKQDFKDVEARFRKMGFDYVYPPNTPIECTLVDIRRAVGLTEPAVEMVEDGEEAMKNSTLQAATTIGITTESTLL